MKHDASSSYTYVFASGHAEHWHELTYWLHNHLPSTPALLIWERRVCSNEYVVFLCQADGLVHDREVPVIHA